MGRTRKLLIRGASEVLTCASSAPDLVGREITADVLVEDGRIVAVGKMDEVAADDVLDAAGGVVMPGFVDCHTHAVFGGDRVDEYAARVAGEEPPPGVPVGILGTVEITSGLSVDELVAETRPRLLEMLEHGTTTVEIKSGYGLAEDAELRMLEAADRLGSEGPLTVVGTYLGAHAFPPGKAHDAYVEEVVATIPTVAERGLAAFCDVYCDEGYFDPQAAHRILAAGKKHGLEPKVHLDAYASTGFAGQAVELGAASVDHLNYTTPAEIERLAEARLVGVVMPCLDFAVDHPRPTRARELVDLGLTVALATDMCPGCHTASMQVVIQHACRSGGISVAAAIRAATLHAAAAVGLADEVGSLEPGKSADVLILDVPTFEDLAYRLGHNAVRTVVKNGEVVVRRPETTSSPLRVSLDATTTERREDAWALASP